MSHRMLDRTAALAPGGSMKILVVDDNRDAADSLAMVLRLCGHETAAAHDGPGALTVAEQFRPEVVLCDLGMPRMTGYEVARRLRETYGPSAPRLVAVTGYTRDDDRRRTEEEGFLAHLIKPVDHDALLRLLATWQDQ